MSAKMLERYSHTRDQAKREAVGKLPRRRSRGQGPHKIPPQSRPTTEPKSPKLLNLMVGEAGIEPTTPGLEGRCSIQLSYSPVVTAFTIVMVIAVSNTARNTLWASASVAAQAAV